MDGKRVARKLKVKKKAKENRKAKNCIEYYMYSYIEDPIYIEYLKYRKYSNSDRLID